MKEKEMTSAEWKEYAEKVISDIDSFDKRTFWRPNEPQWWYDMMEIRQRLQELLKK